MPPQPKWHPIRFSKSSPECGQILVSFVVSEISDYKFKIERADDVQMSGMIEKAEDVRKFGKPYQEPLVKFENFEVEINVLGLRGLQSAGILPVKKAYIEFMLNSIIPPGKLSYSVENKFTLPGPTGPNPTINTVVSFKVVMPIDEIYSPCITCRVFDKIFKGLSGNLIGQFNIPLGLILQ